MKWLDETVAVAGQIRPEDLPGMAAEGVTMIVNNRPDGEEPGQPFASKIELAAREAGLSYRHLPVAGGLYPDQVQAMAEALAAANGKTLAFCRSGTRSTYLWALARVWAGADAEGTVRMAAAAGYDLTPILPFLGR